MILVDTSVWIEASKRSGVAVAAEVRSLLADDEVAITDVVIGELLQGSRTDMEFDGWADRLQGLHYFPASRDVWERAARLSFNLRREGSTTALSDLVIATVAMDNDLAVYAIDSDFSRVAGLRLHRPASPA